MVRWQREIKRVVHKNLAAYKVVEVPPELLEMSFNVPLHMAIFEGDTEAVAEIFRHPPVKGLDQVDLHGNTPLVLSVMRRHLDIANILINQGANVDVPCDNGKKAL